MVLTDWCGPVGDCLGTALVAAGDDNPISYRHVFLQNSSVTVMRSPQSGDETRGHVLGWQSTKPRIPTPQAFAATRALDRSFHARGKTRAYGRAWDAPRPPEHGPQLGREDRGRSPTDLSLARRLITPRRKGAEPV